MALNTLLIAAAGAASALGFQDPGFDHQFAVPSSNEVQFAGTASLEDPITVSGYEVDLAQNPVTIETEPISWVYEAGQDGKRLTASFDNANAKEIFGWLRDQGISFMTGEAALNSDVRINLNIVNEPASDVLDALAAALGGHWQMRGNIRVFADGPGPDLFRFGNGKAFAPVPGVPGAPGAPAKAFGQGWMPREAPLIAEGRAYQLDKKALAELKALEKKEFADLKMDHKAFEELAKQHQFMELKGMPAMPPMAGMQGAMPGHPQQIEIRIEKDGKTITKHVNVSRGQVIVKINGDDIKIEHGAGTMNVPVDVKVHVEKAMADAKQHIAKARDHAKLHDKEIEVIIANAKKSADHEVAKAMKVYETAKIAHGRAGSAKLSQGNARQLLDSLTPTQQHSLRMRGYVLYIDLSSDQKKLLGEVPKGKFTLKYKFDDGREFEIRGS